MREKWEELKERWKALLGDAQAWFNRLTERERKLVVLMGGAFGFFVLFVLIFSFSSSAQGYRKRTQDKLTKLQAIQTLAGTYQEAQVQRQQVESRLAQGAEMQLLTFVQERGERAGVDIPTLNPKGDAPIGDGKIIESSVEVTLTDIKLNQLNLFLANLEEAPGIVKVKFVRIEPRPASEVLTAWVTISSYKLKPQ